MFYVGRKISKWGGIFILYNACPINGKDFKPINWELHEPEFVKKYSE
jgi:hypothetical protein